MHAASVALAATAAALLLGGASAAQDATGAADPSVVRLLTVGAVLTENQATGSTVLDAILAEFEARTGYDVVVTQGEIDIFDQARVGGADIVIAHHGFTPLHEVALEGVGQWPATIMSNSVAFLVPPGDPAGVRSTADPYQAFEAIAARQMPFVVNNLGETLYITDVLYEAAGRPDPNDSIMQRILATVVVRRPPGLVNLEGGIALQEHLTQPATQAQIRAFRIPEIDGPIFWPAGNQNDN